MAAAHKLHETWAAVTYIRKRTPGDDGGYPDNHLEVELKPARRPRISDLTQLATPCHSFT